MRRARRVVKGAKWGYYAAHLVTWSLNYLIFIGTLVMRSFLVALALALSSVPAAAQESCKLNPATLPYSPGYAQLVIAPDQRTVYIAGQVAQDSSGTVVGVGDFGAQVEHTFGNLRRALEAVGATFAHVVKWNYYVTDASRVAQVREIRDRVLAGIAPPASTLVEVKGLFRPDVLIEIEAVAVAPRALPCAELRRLERRAPARPSPGAAGAG